MGFSSDPSTNRLDELERLLRPFQSDNLRDLVHHLARRSEARGEGLRYATKLDEGPGLRKAVEQAVAAQMAPEELVRAAWERWRKAGGGLGARRWRPA